MDYSLVNFLCEWENLPEPRGLKKELAYWLYKRGHQDGAALALLRDAKTEADFIFIINNFGEPDYTMAQAVYKMMVSEIKA